MKGGESSVGSRRVISSGFKYLWDSSFFFFFFFLLLKMQPIAGDLSSLQFVRPARLLQAN